MALVLCRPGAAQQYTPPEIDLSQLADQFFSYPENDLDYEALYENLAQLLAQPVDINTATAETLRMLPALRETQVQGLIAYRTAYGPLLSLYELQAVPELDAETLSRLVPFITLRASTAGWQGLAGRILEEKNNYLLARYERILESPRGFTSASNPFRGSPNKLYLRFRTGRVNDFSLGFTAEQDAGEPFRWHPASRHYGFDYWSGYVQAQHKGRLRNLVVGDYQAQFGQGLVLGGGFGMGKGAETVTAVRRPSLGFLPYSSVNEAGFLRGAAATYSLNARLQLSAFVSAVSRDAVLSEDTVDSVVTAWQVSGLHRTASELDARKRIPEQNYGAVLHYKAGRYDAGVVYHRLQLPYPVQKRSLPYNQFAFAGTHNDNFSFFANVSLHNFLFFHEVAKTAGHGSAWVAGVLGSLTPKLDAAVLYRRYSRDFQTFSTNAFAESTAPQNESGIYWGWKYRVTRVYGLSGYVDLFTFPWVRFRSYSPSQGHEWLIRGSFQPAKKIMAFAQIREEQKMRNVAIGAAPLYRPATGAKRSYQVQFDYTVHAALRLRTRAQFSTYALAGRQTQGMALMQDAMLHIGKLDITVRHALFDTEDYDNRQYAYENDVWLAYSLPAYDGRGTRNYILLDYPVTPRLTLWVRYARTRYRDREEIGSGPDAIPGNQRNDVKFQLRIKL